MEGIGTEIDFAYFMVSFLLSCGGIRETHEYSRNICFFAQIRKEKFMNKNQTICRFNEYGSSFYLFRKERR